MRLHSKITLAKDVKLNGYKTLEAGTALEVVKYNKRYIYVIEPIRQATIIQLTYSDAGQKSPIKRRKKQSKSTGDAELDRLFGITPKE